MYVLSECLLKFTTSLERWAQFVALGIFLAFHRMAEYYVRVAYKKHPYVNLAVLCIYLAGAFLVSMLGDFHIPVFYIYV